MIIVYFKQAWQLLKQNRFYTGIYILATGFSIALVMVLAIVFYIKIANIYPETGRNRLLIVETGKVLRPDSTRSQYGLSLETVRQCLYPLQKAEAVSAVYRGRGKNYIQPENKEPQIPVTVKYVDTGFWKVFAFSFINGKAFSEADMESAMQTVVITASLARRLFGNTEVTGKYIHLNFTPYRICGVVKDVSYLANKTFAQLWMPYTACPGFRAALSGNNDGQTLGTFAGYALAPSVKAVDKLKEEIQSNVSRYDASLGELKFSIDGPDRQWRSVFRLSRGQTEGEFTQLLLQYAFIFLVLLLIPAISLSGMAESQMERRISEIGVRRAFGAPKGSLLWQLIMENLLFTILGGLLGLGTSYLLVYFFRDWILHWGINQMFYSVIPEGVDVLLSPGMLMNYTVFLVALGVCLVLNLMTTVIPAWHASRREIVYSLNSK
ncbi:ABC transporter permease [Parabacteroides sp. OttesenSCG-928-J18]|nr:ABC transporter permease [Parabacteroides sp. OttesenSCG-928-J18]